MRIITSAVSINFPKNIFFADITKNALVNFVNQGREAVGLEPLMENSKLDQAAVLKAQDMIRNNYFAHKSPQGITPWYWFLQSGYNYKYAGENLAIGFLDSKEVYNAWYNSPSHKENILNPNYKEVGTAVLDGNFGAGNTAIVVQFFGSPLEVKVPATVTANPRIAQPQTEVSAPEQKTEVGLEPEAASQEVLSQISEYPQLKQPEGDTDNTFYLRLLNFIMYNYEEILKRIIYGFLILVSLAALLNIVIHFNIQHTDIILRSLLIFTLLCLSLIIDADTITFLVPHKIVI